MKNETRFMLALCTVFAAVTIMGSTEVDAAPYVELKNGKKIAGTAIYAKSNGDVVLTTTQGTQTFTKDQYKRAVADKPAEFDKAMKLAGAGRIADAIPLLEGVVKSHRGLQWDIQAMGMLGKLYVSKGDFRSAMKTFEALFSSEPAAKSSELRWGYYEALIGAKQYSKLDKDLDKIIAKGSREDAAKAQIVRGDIKTARGDAEAAAMDYLRTVILFKSVKGHQAEALYKAGQSLEKLRDSRSKKMFQELAQNYPQSEWAKKARSK